MLPMEREARNNDGALTAPVNISLWSNSQKSFRHNRKIYFFLKSFQFIPEWQSQVGIDGDLSSDWNVELERAWARGNGGASEASPPVYSVSPLIYYIFRLGGKIVPNFGDQPPGGGRHSSAGFHVGCRSDMKISQKV